MKLNSLTPIILIAIAAFTFGTGEAQAQLNERKVERSASGRYNLRMTKIKRKRLAHMGHHGYTETIDSARLKMRIPVKDGRLKSSINDDELGGSDSAALRGREKRSDVKRGGRLILYKATGKMDIKADGHNPYRDGVSNGDLKKRSGKWIADLIQRAKRLDNDGATSIFSSEANGNH
jgi:hypothetical protein